MASSRNKSAKTSRTRRLAAGAGIFLLLGAAACEVLYRGFLFLKARPAAPAEEIFELYAIGGSTTRGEPIPDNSFAVMAARLLGGRIDGRKIVVRNLARDGDSIYPQWHRFTRAASRRLKTPGAVLIYSGHNEGRFLDSDGSGIFKRPFVVPSLILSDMLYRLREDRIIDRRHSLAWYGFYMRATIESALESGLLPILSSVASNISGVEPNVEDAFSFDPGHPVVTRGRAMEGQKEFLQAVRHYTDAAQSDRRLRPYLLYRAGKCYEALGRCPEAREYYWRAVDSDPQTSFGRATRAQNRLLRQIASDYGIPFVDSVAFFEENSPCGILGNELFHDFHHPNLKGYLLLARGFSDVISKRFDAPLGRIPVSNEEMMDIFSISDGEMAQAFEESGSFMLRYAASRYPWPEDRLELAEINFREAVKIDPWSRIALLGLAVVEVAKRSSLLRDERLSEDLLGPFMRAPDDETTRLSLRILRENGAREALVRKVEFAIESSR